MKKGKCKNSSLLPNSLKIISSCLKTVSTNASTVVRSAGASVAASISASSDDRRDQVTWAGFDKIEFGPTTFKHVLLLGYLNGFQVYDVEDGSNFSELVSKHDGPVTFLQMLPIPAKSDSDEGFRSSHPLLLVVAGDEPNNLRLSQTGAHGAHLNSLSRGATLECHPAKHVNFPTAIRFYSLRSNCFVKMMKFQSAVCMVRCSSRIVAISLATQIYCIDALTLENKFSVLTSPVPQLGGQGSIAVNCGYGPMAVGPRWLAYASSNLLVSSAGRVSPKNLTPSPGVSPLTSPSSGSMMARYAMESSKQLAAGIINLGDMGYKTVSRYCPDLLLDGPITQVPSSSGRKIGRLTASEMENAGMVIVKDFISRAVISQFRAHKSPISALCFDPSGTLLVTASVCGNNINIFRIIPSCTHNESGNQSYDWSSAHVHLYKLHRGITTAIIQDICFSHYGQWVAIISNKGTCHIYVLSPFGGDVGFQTIDSHGEEALLNPVLTQPWWSTSSFNINHHFSPPPPITLSVVARIRDGNSGLLNSVTNAATSAAGKVSTPSGAVAAIFHNSLSHGCRDIHVRANSLEHLLVYTPSGHVVQHELIPLKGLELSDTDLKTQSGYHMHTSDEEIRVKVEPIQWWDVCRRADWLEREESISWTTFSRQEVSQIIGDKGRSRTNFQAINGRILVNEMVKSDLLKPQERSHFYLSNAEVQMNCGRLAIWQKSKIHLHMMSPLAIKGHTGGEFEIERVPLDGVEIKLKDLLPVFDNFCSIKSNWNDRRLSGGMDSHASSLGLHQLRDKVAEEAVICHSKPASLSSTESSDGGSSRRIDYLIELDQKNFDKPITSMSNTGDMLNQKIRGSTDAESFMWKQKSEHLENTNSHFVGSITNQSSLVESDVPTGRKAIARAALTSDTCGRRDDQVLTHDPFDSAMNTSSEGCEPSRLQNSVDLESLSQEGYCKALESDGYCKLADVVTDEYQVNCSKEHHERENPEDDRDNDELPGGVFSFFDQGKTVRVMNTTYLVSHKGGLMPTNC
ncbi:autophagy-related protein 18g isoform X2 [Diospyros lotus]|uniref:autophagy-related protein 18g isoform X2 n=1 Tax=Diospyros lotus TaxID=55363 RepID=UPI00225338DB|nr:autophagy-related protein 18g isoform X2 [Diospyros lotus]